MASEITSSKVGRPNGYGILTHTTISGDRWYAGNVATPHGFCAVYADKGAYALRFIHNGREYYVSKRRCMSVRGLVTKAARFADAVVRGEHG